MEICILKFYGRHSAEKALKEVIDAQGDRNPWLHDIGMIARPLIGRVRVAATFPDGKSKTFHEGDLADAIAGLGAYTGYFVSSLAGPIGSMVATTNATLAAGERGDELEAQLFHLDEVKQALSRDSSALVLIAEPKVCDVMVQLFQPYDAAVVRRDVREELHKRLQALHDRLAQKMAQARQEEAPATH